MLAQATEWTAAALAQISGSAAHAIALDSPVGSGSHLPLPVLITATISAGLSTILSVATVWLQLKHYHKPHLQRLVVRILVMVPIYSIASLISLYSLELAFFLDAIRDVYEAFVIYCFFSLLVEYLGGERSLIITLHGRDPVLHPWPVNLFLHPMDASDPFTFLGIKRGVLQYVQIKPLLALTTVILKATGTYKDGSLAKDSGYTYVSIVYNISVSLSLYCLAMFWVATSNDLKPYRPMPKFLSVKGIIFFSFWQGFAVSIGVAAGILRSSRYDTEQLSLAVQDTLVCFEMPLFAFLHLYAFSYTDYVDENHVYSGRLPVWHALKDAFGYKDLFLDSLETLRGSGFSYRTYEPASGTIHASGLVRDRRIRAGLRYSIAGQRKYWLNQPGREEDAYGRRGDGMLGGGLSSRPIHEVHRRLEERVEAHEGYAPGSHSIEDVLHVDPEWAEAERAKKRAMEDSAGPLGLGWWEGGRAYDELSDGEVSEPESLEFHPPEDREEKEVERLYRESRDLEYGDWKYPVVDASREAARRRVRDEEDAILSGRLHLRHSKPNRPAAKHRPGSYGALAEREPLVRRDSPAFAAELEADKKHKQSTRRTSSSRSALATSADHPIPIGSSLLEGASRVLHATLPIGSPDKDALHERAREHEEQRRLPPDAVDLVVEDAEAEEAQQMRQRRRGEPGGKMTRVYRVAYVPPPSVSDSEIEEIRQLDPKMAEEGATVKSPLPDEEAHVLDIVERDEAADGPVPGTAADGQYRANGGEGASASGSGEGVEKDEVVRIAVQEHETHVKQAGVDETSRKGQDRSPFPRGHPILKDEDNPWR